MKKKKQMNTQFESVSEEAFKCMIHSTKLITSKCERTAPSMDKSLLTSHLQSKVSSCHIGYMSGRRSLVE